ncbi:MAG: polyisoprenoid-binding protein [Bacteroidetes bacterium]|uniref:YceI family protein n=1 Tax=Phaeocystidibacter marisrubri TaxID=1577780 RepID=A0A6L3ZHV5_9FLAO|nr:YceI family protein [Phaeocystidibacter marisrubri]KAB2817444.1 YceI family protein [Phaeocystidibacter marisrubri]TNE27223.1 MAG: polyisoprenoid-binding protein [Bacteroidota bacterium]
MSTQKWALDTTHTNIQFKAKHLMITTVTGNFGSVEGSVEMEGEDFTTGKYTFAADVASVTTGSQDRDNHLRSDDFFNAEEYPKLTFVGSEVSNVKDNEFDLTGEMTIRDVTKPVTIRIEVGGTVVDPWGNTKAAFSFKGSLNRKDFGLKFHVVNEAGNLLVSDEIKLEGEVQLAKVAEEVEA